MSDCHVSSPVSDKLDQRWMRISEGEKIRCLCADITATCCSMNLDLARLAVEFKSSPNRSQNKCMLSPFPIRMMFKSDALLDLTEPGRGTVDFSSLMPILPNMDISLRNMLKLWSRLCRLFSIESDGAFRLDDFDCSTKFTMALESEKNVEDVEIITVDDANSEVDVIESEALEMNEDEHVINYEASLANSFYRHELKTEILSDRHNEYGNMCSLNRLQALKDLLFRLASRIPGKLKTDLSIFDSPYYERWTNIIHTSTNGRMLHQALVLLQSSVRHELLAKWWKRGWSSSYGAFCSSNSLSQFALRLNVFDLVIADYFENNEVISDSTLTDEEDTAVATKNKVSFPVKPQRQLIQVEKMMEALNETDVNNSVNRTMRMSYKARAELISKLAGKHSIPIFDGISGDSCRVCASGGDLLCCEYCNQVQHMGCCNPPLKDQPDFDFVCDDCVKDIMVTDIYWKKFGNVSSSST